MTTKRLKDVKVLKAGHGYIEVALSASNRDLSTILGMFKSTQNGPINMFYILEHPEALFRVTPDSAVFIANLRSPPRMLGYEHLSDVKVGDIVNIGFDWQEIDQGACLILLWLSKSHREKLDLKEGFEETPFFNQVVEDDGQPRNYLH